MKEADFVKVIFLDYNGVLDTNFNIDEIDYSNLQRLKRIIKETDAKIVLTSSIKNSYFYSGKHNKIYLKLSEKLKQEGLEIFDITKQLETRELEIMDYLKTHKDIENFCIIDDDYEMQNLKENLVKLPNQMVEGQLGLDEYHTKKAIKILKKL